MAIKVTRLQDVFNNRVQDSVVVPTIWVDEDGVEHEDTTHDIISGDGISSVLFSSLLLLPEPNRISAVYTVPGQIKQVGSHVIAVGALSNIAPKSFVDPYQFDLSQTFKYARNLEALYSTFSHFIYSSEEGWLKEIPEDLFYGCPKLRILSSTFARTTFSKIPNKLFSKNPALESVDKLFYNSSIESVPGDLFRNNSKLSRVRQCFSLCLRLKKVGDGLFKNQKNLSTEQKIIAEVFSDTAFLDKLMESNLTIEDIRDKWFAPNITDDQIGALIADDWDEPDVVTITRHRTVEDVLDDLSTMS